MADQDELDYAISTDDESHAEEKEQQVKVKSDFKKAPSKVVAKRRKQTKDILTGTNLNAYRENGFVATMSQWPACYSLVMFYILSKVSLYFETSIGYKLAAMSYRQTMLLTFVIIVVARNVFIPSRLHKFDKRKGEKQEKKSSSKKSKRRQ